MIWNGKVEQLILLSIPASMIGLFWIVTVFTAVTGAQGALPVAVIWIENDVVSFDPGVYCVTNWLALVNNPFEVPTVDQSTDVEYVVVAEAEYTAPWQTVSVGEVTTVGALVILILISLKSDKLQFDVLVAVNLKITKPFAISAALKV